MTKSLIIAGGCFWGMEELFRTRPGVINTEVGYTGGKNTNPTYDFHPGHAEALLIEYDESTVTLDSLYDYFFSIHDPTTLNRQGNDIGTSYRSAIFYADSQQKQQAEQAILRAADFWKKPITTMLEPLDSFYTAESYHQDYLQKHPGGYTCHYERHA